MIRCFRGLFQHGLKIIDDSEYRTVVVHLLPKQVAGVRFPLLAQTSSRPKSGLRLWSEQG